MKLPRPRVSGNDALIAVALSRQVSSSSMTTIIESFVYKQGAVTAPPVYGTWNDLFNAVKAVKGIKVIGVDGSLNGNVCVVPSGDWTSMAAVAEVEWSSIGPQAAVLQTTNGAKLPWPRAIRSLGAIGGAVTSPVFVATDPIEFFNVLDIYDTQVQGAANTTSLFRSQTNGFPTINLYGFAALMANSIDCSADSFGYEVVLYDNGAVQANACQNTGGLTGGAAPVIFRNSLGSAASPTQATNVVFSTEIIPGVLVVPMGDANQTPPNVQAWTIRCTGALTADRNLVLPLTNGLTSPVVNTGFGYMIHNVTTGGHNINVIGTSGAGVLVAAGQPVWVYTDGTNWY